MSESFLPDRWKELGPLLDAALEREPHERTAFIDRACAGDTALRVELETLLAECARSDRLFASGAVERFAALLAEPPRGLPETVADRYRVGREIGAGGMATVYIARDLKHDREVALKVLRGDLSAVIGAERFLAEVRITAKLDHPHVLTLIDSGEADGMLFYVMPYVRGESLRAKLERERQLPIEDAVSIARQVASALDYAHAQGVVHRDIKPENILLQEGEAVLTDFGIALAVKEAGGTRLTETGLSLGTPQYMSPEQATGDRALDARSDIYSLAAVLYEMIAGEPPVTGATKQAIIAKLLTERPTKLGTVRDTVPESVDRAVLKALSKVPADRFATAGEFARALDAAVAAMPVRRRSNTAILAAAGVVAAGALAGLLVRGKSDGSSQAGVTLRDRTQITFTGNAANPAISSDGKTLAYRTTDCRVNGCTYGIQLQDVDGVASRPLVDGASAIYEMEWSPDRRNLLFHGTITPPFGTFLVSTLGDTPRRVSYNSTFFAGGDSLLSLRSAAATNWVLVSGLDGLAQDSIQVAGTGVQSFAAVPRSKWIVVGSREGSSWEVRVIQRDGRVVSRKLFDGVRPPVELHASSDALWIAPFAAAAFTSSKRTVMRIPLDAVSGQLSSIVDTLYSGVLGWFSVTADGRSLVFDEGTTEFDLWGLDLSEAVRDVYPEQKRLLHSTERLDVGLSPDGGRVLVGRGAGSDGARQRWSTIPFGGGAETPLALGAQHVFASWSDSATAATMEWTRTSARLALVDVGTGAVREPLGVPDKTGWYSHVLSGGWAWLTPNGREGVRVQLPGDSLPRRIPVPPGYLSLISVDASRNARKLAFTGWTPNEDSVVVGMISLADGAVTHWLTIFGEGGRVGTLKDGTLLLRLLDTHETWSVHHLLGPGRAENLGRILRPVSSLSVSEDLKRAAVVTRDYHGDAWMSQVVVRP